MIHELRNYQYEGFSQLLAREIHGKAFDCLEGEKISSASLQMEGVNVFSCNYYLPYANILGVLQMLVLGPLISLLINDLLVDDDILS